MEGGNEDEREAVEQVPQAGDRHQNAQEAREVPRPVEQVPDAEAEASEEEETHRPAAPVGLDEEVRQRVPLPPGQYYIVIDNSSRVGTTNPPWNPLGVVGGNSATVSYVVELGEADE